MDSVGNRPNLLNIQRRSLRLKWLISIGFLVLLVRAFSLMGMEAPSIERLSDVQFSETVRQVGSRGVLVDRYNEVLVETERGYHLMVFNNSLSKTMRQIT